MAGVALASMASTRAQMHATRPPLDSQAGAVAHDAIGTLSIYEHQRAPSTHTHTRATPTDRNNAALNLRDLKLAFPVPPERRRSTPLFYSDDCGTPMSHEIADVLFFAACVLCFEPSVANALSLHSGRVWLACALLVSDHQNPTIQAMCRWLSPAAVWIYAHMIPEQYMRILSDARSANVTSRLASNIPVCDGDGYVQAIRRGGSVWRLSLPPVATTMRLVVLAAATGSGSLRRRIRRGRRRRRVR